MTSPNPRLLARRRSQLRWRLSYLALGLLAFLAARVAVQTVLSRAPVVRTDVHPALMHLLASYRATLHQAGVWLTVAAVLLIVLTVVQLYQVGGKRQRTRRSSKRCPDCAGRLQRHTIRVGKAAGQSFWACAQHPACGYSSRRSRSTS